jgi:hypothetical protein
MAKEMLSCRIDADLRDSLAADASREGRSVANMLERILAERYRRVSPSGNIDPPFPTHQSVGGVTERGSVPKGHSPKPEAAEGGDVPGMSEGAGSGGASSAPRSVTPSEVAATVTGVTLGVRPHMRKDRPALQCEARIPVGEQCDVCGAVL